MKKSLLLFIFFYIPFFIFSQSKADLGVSLGVAYYHGDINKSKIFYSPSMAYGVIIKYNVNNYIAVGIKGSYATLSGSDADFDLVENQNRQASFSTNLIDISLTMDYNMLPFTSSGYIKKNKYRFAPYLTLGVGTNYLFSSGGFENPITIPFGLGIKYNIFERLTVGAEWTYRKTFNDLIDGVINVQDDSNTPVIHNDDWYSFCGFFVTYKLFRDKIDCPAYYD